MSRKRNQPGQRQVSIEVGGSVLRLVIMQQDSANGPVAVSSHEVPWRQSARSLASESGQAELTSALKQLSIAHKLSGTTVWLTLTGVFCVTRVLTGDSDTVRHEMRDLEQRSQLYLSLGPGHKALAGSIRQIDARHQHALLTVTNQKTLDTLMAATTAAGLHVKLIEPSLFALSRTLAKLQLGQSDPVVVVHLEENGVEVGIFYNGMLLLDYRPGGKSVHNNVADIVVQHLPRLQRYCSRYFRFITGKLSQVYLCGEEEATQRVLKDLKEFDEVTAKPLTLEPLTADWDFADGVPRNPFAPVIGSCWAMLQKEPLGSGPNLLNHLQQEDSISLSQGAKRFIWPVAAAALIVACMLGLTFYERAQVDDLRAEVAEFEASRSKARILRLSLVQSESKEKMLAQIDRQIDQPTWSQFWATIGGCLPRNVWIDGLKIEGAGLVSINGTCFSENGLFEFVHWLKQMPELSEVALTTTRPTRYNGLDAISFQLECHLADFTDSKEDEDQHD